MRYLLLALVFVAALFADDRPPVAFPRTAGIAIPWNNTQVLLLAGYTSYAGSSQSSAELYDYKTGKSIAVPPCPFYLDPVGLMANASAVRLNDGRVFACSDQSCALLSTDRSVWTLTGVPKTAGATLLVMADGTVLSVGGLVAGMVTNVTTVFDPQTNGWAPTGNLQDSRLGAVLVLLPDGRAAAIDGDLISFCPYCKVQVSDVPIGSIEVYDPAQRTWTLAPVNGPSNPGPLQATLLADGQVLASNGQTEIFDPTSNDLRDTTAVIPPFVGGTLLPTGESLLISSAPTNVFTYDPTTGTTRQLLPLTNPLYYRMLAAMPDGTVLVIGGSGLTLFASAATTVESVAWEPHFTTTLDPGFYIATATQNDGGRDGLAGIEVDTPGAIDGGLFFGGLLAAGGQDLGFGSFTVGSSAGSTAPIQFDLSLEALPGSAGPLEATAQIFDANHQLIITTSGVGGIHWNQALPPGFYVIELRSSSRAPAAAFQMNVGAQQFLGGGSYGATLQQSAGVMGYVAFFLPTRQSVTLKLSNENTFGRPRGSGETILTLLDSNRNILRRMGPGGMTNWTPGQ